MSTSSIYAEPRHIESLEDCYFYHTMEIPGYGHVTGQWDLRPNVEKYLGGTDLKGKRVLEVGTASGYLCMHMARKGAEVVAYDLSDKESVDIVPFARHDWKRRVNEGKTFMRRINNSFWLNHRVHQSKAKVVYGTAYAIPQAIGAVDVSIFGAILLHIRDPFLALQNAARLTRETIIVTEPQWHWHWRHLWRYLFLSKQLDGHLVFLPDAQSGQPITTWWLTSPAVIKKFLSILGFEDAQVSYHFQKQEGSGRVRFYTVVAKRTTPFVLGEDPN